MKAFLFILAALTAGASARAGGRDVQGRFLEPIIGAIFDDLIIDIIEAGMDPYKIENEQLTYSLPVTDLLHVQAGLEDLLVEGLSNLVLSDVNFGLLAARLRMTISLPRLSLSIGSADASVDFASLHASGGISGSVHIVGVRVAIDTRLDGISIIGIIGGAGISIRTLDVEFNLQGVESNLNIQLFGENQSDLANGILGDVVPNFFVNYRNDVNELLSYLLVDVLNGMLGSD